MVLYSWWESESYNKKVQTCFNRDLLVFFRRILMSLEYVKEFFLKYIQGKKKSKKEEHNLKQYRVN